MASSKPGGGTAEGRGRVAVDWEQAFAYYASLQPGERTYAAVAAAFPPISPRTVERHGREDGWRQRLREIDAEVAASTNASIAHDRVEQALKTIKLIQASFIAYAEKLRRGEIRMVPGDLEKLNRLMEQLTGELASPAVATAPGSAAPLRPADELGAVLEALDDSGALATLGLQLLRVPESASRVA